MTTTYFGQPYVPTQVRAKKLGNVYVALANTGYTVVAAPPPNVRIAVHEVVIINASAGAIYANINIAAAPGPTNPAVWQEQALPANTTRRLGAEIGATNIPLFWLGQWSMGLGSPQGLYCYSLNAAAMYVVAYGVEFVIQT